jgi:hypothetical protein
MIRQRCSEPPWQSQFNGDLAVVASCAFGGARRWEAPFPGAVMPGNAPLMSVSNLDAKSIRHHIFTFSIHGGDIIIAG